LSGNAYKVPCPPLPMLITAHIDRENRTKPLALDRGANVSGLLRALGINPVTVIVARNGEVVMEDDELHDGDSLSIMSVVSGG